MHKAICPVLCLTLRTVNEIVDEDGAREILEAFMAPLIGYEAYREKMLQWLVD